LIIKSITQGLSATGFYGRDYDKNDAYKKSIKISGTHMYATIDVQHQLRKTHEDENDENKCLL